MLKRGAIVILFGIVLLLVSYYADATSQCGDMGGNCYFDHQLYNGRCPSLLPRQVTGLDAEVLCWGHFEAPGTGSAIADITGLTYEGINCCLPPYQGPVCGDGEINRESEQCDGNDFNEQTCSDFGNFNSGNLRCTGYCTIDQSDCRYQPQEINLELSISTESLLCHEEGFKEVVLTLRNLGDSINSIYIYDTIYYDYDCDGSGRVYMDYINKEFYCEDLLYNRRCINRYYADFNFPGCYYHNVIATRERVDWSNLGG